MSSGCEMDPCPQRMPLGLCLESGAPECHSGPTAATHQHPGHHMPRGYQ